MQSLKMACVAKYFLRTPSSAAPFPTLFQRCVHTNALHSVCLNTWLTMDHPAFYTSFFPLPPSSRSLASPYLQCVTRSIFGVFMAAADSPSADASQLRGGGRT